MFAKQQMLCDVKLREYFCSVHLDHPTKHLTSVNYTRNVVQHVAMLMKRSTLVIVNSLDHGKVHVLICVTSHQHLITHICWTNDYNFITLFFVFCIRINTLFIFSIRIISLVCITINIIIFNITYCSSNVCSWCTLVHLCINQLSGSKYVRNVMIVI